ncbi:MAG: DUF58 domain-containing protein [Gammaproteobacteria bacterium]|nr:DUF58 domain-containing protein [Gammaproteobacteria bacterium]
MARLTFDELFDSEFLSALEVFDLRIKRFIRQGRHGEQLSHDRGFGQEFKDFKAYVPGDDLRAVNWSIYQRLGRLFVHVFEEYQDLPVYLLVDLSKSMFLEDPPRIVAGLRTALALGAIAAGQHDIVSLFSFSDNLDMQTKPISSKGQLIVLARQMAELDELDRTNLSDVLDELSHQKLRRGLLVIVSDFFDPSGIEAIDDAIRKVRHKILLIQLTKEEDADPELNPEIVGDLRLVDCELDDAIDVTIEPQVIREYKRIYGTFNEALIELADSLGSGLVQIDCEKDILDQLSLMFQTRNLLV